MENELDKSLDEIVWNNKFIWDWYGILGFSFFLHFSRYRYERYFLEWKANKGRMMEEKSSYGENKKVIKKREPMGEKSIDSRFLSFSYEKQRVPLFLLARIRGVF